MLHTTNNVSNSPKRFKKSNFRINEKYSSGEALSSYRDWMENCEGDYIDQGIIFVKKPFTAFQFQNFISDERLLTSLMDQVNDFNYKPTENDLHCFSKTDQLDTFEEGAFGLLRNFVRNDLRPWVEDMCSLRLHHDKVDLFAAKYNLGDVLLCHDDQISTRKIAFILYLCPNWEDEDGGKLDLINSDDSGNPVAIERSLNIGFNVFNFFIVCPTSFHQVAEVLSPKTRLSISGWFHSVDKEDTPSHRELPETHLVSLPSNSLDLSAFLNETYLTDSSREEIRKHFEDTSFITLHSFLDQSVHDSLLESLRELEDSAWRRVGPLDVCNFDVLGGDHTVMEIMQSPDMRRYLEDVSQVEIGTQARVEVLRLGRGMYSLINDRKDPLSQCDTLCCYFTLNDKYFDSNVSGGYFVFLDPEDGAELERVANSVGNSLALLYVNAGTDSFIKYINCRFGEAGEWFYVVRAVFPELE